MEFDYIKYAKDGIVVEDKVKEIINRLIYIFNKEYDMCLCFEDIIIREKEFDRITSYYVIFKDVIFSSGFKCIAFMEKFFSSNQNIAYHQIKSGRH